MQYLINSLDDLKKTVSELITHDRLAHDTETTGPNDVGGLYPFHGSRSFSHIFATKPDEYYFNFNTGGINPKYKILLQPIFDDPNRIIFYCNAVYDACISHFDGLVFKNRVIDCPSIARVEFNRHGRQAWVEESFLSMAYLAQHYGVKLKDDRVKEYIIQNELYSPQRSRFNGEKIPQYDRVPLQLMYEYGCGDARTTFDLGTRIIQCINEKDAKYNHDTNMINIAKNEIKLTSVLIDMKIRGFKIDRNYVESQIEIESENLKNLTAEVKNITGEMNLNSGKQLAEFLISQSIEIPRKDPTENALVMAKKWREKVSLAIPNSKQHIQAIQKAQEYLKGNYITDKKTLAKILEQNPTLDFLSKLTKAKETEKKISTYYKNFLLLADENDVIHANLNQEKAITGRFSASDPNLQNTHKKDKSVKRSFITGDPDFDILCIDFDQCEMMVMLDQAGEMSIINKLIDKVYDDFYLATGAVLLEVAGITIDRQQAKAIALGLTYGQGKDLLATSLKMTVEAANNFKNEFFKALPALKKFDSDLQNQVKYHGRIHNPFGRVSYLAKDESYKALNSFIQGSSADIMKVAMVNIFEFLKPFKTKLILVVHDEGIFRLNKKEHHLIPELQRIMSEAYPFKHIALGTGVELSETNWGDKKPYEK
jgi:DNA polymerase I-like protein with 3'-5' exonuclease and polymerase domains